MNDIKKHIDELRQRLKYHAKRYYVYDAPEISDYEYDALFKELASLEARYPEYDSPDSPTKRVGGAVLEKFEKFTHSVPLKSLQDVFSYDELASFIEKLDAHEFSVEEKIDGLSVALTYENGVFMSGATRGDGVIGEDVSENLKTIKSIPLKIDYTGKLVVRGEVYMPRKSFEALNSEREANDETLFANPRNAAAGSLRQLDSAVTAKRRLDIFIFNIQECDREFETHAAGLEFLRSLGFSVIPYLRIVKSIGEITDCVEEIERLRETLPFDIDGAVVKVNSIAQRTVIGENTNTPKWAVAYKYPPERKETKLLDIVIQVGRTGVLTPNAVLSPVRLAGTTVSRATLHNADFIAQRDIRIGDTVFVQKAGDIIPEIVSVNTAKRIGNETVYEMPSVCPSCGEPVVSDEEAAVRCTNNSCPAQLVRNLIHFVSRDAMNIDGMGKSIIKSLYENGLLSDVSDIYRLTADMLSPLDRMGDKSASKLVSAIEKSKGNGLEKLLYALGIRQVGEKASAVLAKEYGDIERFFSLGVEELSEIRDIGAITAENIVDYFSHPQTRELVSKLKGYGVETVSKVETGDLRFSGMSFVLTGTLPTLGRREASEMIEYHGGKVSASVSAKTTYVLAGENAGSKLVRAKELGIRIIDEENFRSMLS